jgi:hypothetical protein
VKAVTLAVTRRTPLRLVFLARTRLEQKENKSRARNGPQKEELSSNTIDASIHTRSRCLLSVATATPIIPSRIFAR